MTNTIVNFITIVEFPEPVNGKTIYYFGSIAAIFEYFDPDIIGMRRNDLYRKNTTTKPFDTGKCRISKQTAYRLKRVKE